MSRSFVSGSSQYLGANSAPSTAAPFTMACWFNPSALGVTQALMSIGASGSTDSAFLTTDASNGDIYAFSRQGATIANAIASTGGISTGTWYHACGVWTNSTLRAAFFNGGAKGTDTTAAIPATLNRLAVAARNRNGTVDFYFDGLIAYPAVWDIALSDAEVLSLYTNAPWLVQSGHLLDYWKLTGASPEPSLGSLATNLTVFNGATYNASEPPVTTGSGGNSRLIGGSLIGGALVV